jgi:hypothetical protein
VQGAMPSRLKRYRERVARWNPVGYALFSWATLRERWESL